MNHSIAIRLRELLLARPFRPFSIRMVDGTSCVIPHEDFFSVTRSGSVIFDDGERIHKTLSVTLVTGIDEKLTAA